MNEINRMIKEELIKNNATIQFVAANKINAAATIINIGRKNYIFVNKDIPERLVPLCFYHEISHLNSGKIGTKFIKYNYIMEKRMNLIAIFKMKKCYSIVHLFGYVLAAIFSEHLLFFLFNKKNKMNFKINK